MTEPKSNGQRADSPDGNPGTPKSSTSPSPSPADAKRRAWERSRRYSTAAQSPMQLPNQGIAASLAELNRKALAHIAQTASGRIGPISATPPTGVLLTPAWPVRQANERLQFSGHDVDVDILWWASRAAILVYEPANGERTHNRSIVMPFIDTIQLGGSVSVYVYNGKQENSPSVFGRDRYWGDAKAFLMEGCTNAVIRQLRKLHSWYIDLDDNQPIEDTDGWDPPRVNGAQSFAIDGRPEAAPAAPYPASGAVSDRPGLSWLVDVPGLPNSFFVARRPGRDVLYCADYAFQTWFECNGQILGYYEWGCQLRLKFDDNRTLIPGESTVIPGPGFKGIPGSPDAQSAARYDAARDEFRRLTGR